MNYFLVSILATIFLFSNFAYSKNQKNYLLAQGQGVSSPSLTSLINYSTGFTSDNPAGVVLQDGARVSLQYDKNGSDAFGAELGYGGNSWGLAVGHRKVDCNNCDGHTAGAFGLSVSNFFSLGLRYEEDVIGLGLLFGNADGFQFGVVGNHWDLIGDNNNITLIGAGFSYLGSNYKFAVDASVIAYEDPALKSDILILTPSVGFFVDQIQLSFNYEIYQNLPDNDTTRDEFWAGIGVGGDNFHVAAYIDFVNELSIVGSAFF